MPTAPVQTLLLDFDGLLAHYDHGVHLQRLAAACRACVPQVAQALRQQGLEMAHARGELDGPALLGALNTALGSAVEARHWHAARTAATTLRRDVCDVLAQVRGDVRIAILTNNGALTAPVIEQLLPAYTVLCSASLGVRKPDPAAYLAAVARLNGSPERSLFVDHLFRNVQGARTAGLHADTAWHAQSLRKLLKRYQLL